MWSQTLLLAAAFGLGYYVATRGSDKTSRPSESAQTDDRPSMAGTFPKHSSIGTDAERKQDNRPNTRSRSAKSKRTRKAKVERKQEITTQEPVTDVLAQERPNEPERVTEPTPFVDDTVQKAKPKPIAVDTPTPPVTAAVTTTTTSASSTASSAQVAKPQPADWVAVANRGARPQNAASTPIPVHDTSWSSMANEVNLDEDQNKRPEAARILRIGAPAKPPSAPMPQRRQYTAPPPLTKKQRQSRKKAERQREERAQAAAVQEQRLHSHRRDLFDLRSHEQWERERRKALNGPPKGAPPKQAKGAPSIIDGKLIWN
ncbi:hypothetical protein COEREDRAFT_8465 [Coemansia reversa NRRL 1564]|uniref:Uncharacterized protein n=1 Tax=Coemansia reversa (strain ATCC 12441 / NRRL 1564) TaxID=763665 RepID=A0A2G5BCA2_COERN|nr:hypothetical protein COEREDRAFT_8465 [Coemansia reversa NRRL 1564]|eukprot:PIA16337.1 hypothetical protein COEREDRAFT_8465 [Coemansia reversa NRRL 1564]